MDAVTMYLEAADLLLEDYKEISYFSEVFEAGDESIQEAQQKNAAHELRYPQKQIQHTGQDI